MVNGLDYEVFEAEWEEEEVFAFDEDEDTYEEEPDDSFDEWGFNPYLGCYDYDC